jgi:hypothetical protein
MTNLQDRIQALEDTAPGADITAPSGRLSLVAPPPTVTTGPEAVTVLIDPGILTIGARSLLEPSTSTLAAAFTFLKAPGKLGRIFAEVIGPGGDIHHPTLEGLDGTDSAPGGFGPCSGRISERVYEAHRDVYRQDAKLVVYLESDGTCLHGGRISTPAVAGGAVTIASRGHAARAEKLTEPILYSTEDMSVWKPLVSEDDALDPRPWTVEAQNFGFSSGEVTNLSFRGPSNGDGSAIAWLPGKDPARLTGKIEIGSIPPTNGALVEIQTRRVGFSFDTSINGETPDWGPNIINWVATLGPSVDGTTVLPFDIDLTIDFGALSDPNIAPDNRGPGANAGWVYPDLIQIVCSEDPLIGSPDPITNVDIVDLVIYGAAGPTNFGDRTMSPTELVLDIGGRMGLRLIDVQPHAGNILPYSLEGGMPYADALDWASVLTGWRWRILDTGHRAILEFGPWKETVWQVASPWAKLDVVGMDRFNRARIPFNYKDGLTVGNQLVRADPDPLDHRSYYGLLSLDSPTMNSEAAETLGVQVLKELSRERFAAQFSVGEIVGAQGPCSGHKLMAGDTLDGSPRGAPGGMKIVSKHWGYSFCEGQAGFDSSAGSSMSGIPALDRMLARRTQRLTRNGRAA